MSLLNLNIASVDSGCIIDTNQMIIDSYQNRETLFALVDKCDKAYDRVDRINNLIAVCDRYGYTQSMEALIGKELDAFMRQYPSCESITVLAMILIGLAVAAIIALLGWLLYKLFKKDDKNGDKNGVSDSAVGLKNAIKKIREVINK